MCCDNGALNSHTMSTSAPDPTPGDDLAPPLRTGTSLHYALQLVPPRRRPLIHAALQVWLTMARIPLNMSDPGIAEAKLLWWQQEWQRAAEGQAPQHPLMQVLVRELQGTSQPWPDAAMWKPQFAGWTQLAHQNRWLDQSTLDQHVDATTGQAARLWACLCGATSAEALEAAHQLGVGIRRAHLLARLGQDARAGWVMIGIDLLQRHDVKAHQLSRPGTVAPEGWPGLLQSLTTSAQDALAAGWRQAQQLPPAQRHHLLPLLALARCAHALATEVGHGGDTILHQRMVLTPLRKAWLTWQTRWGLGGLA